MKRLEKEIEFYKEVTGRLTTALFLSIGGTVAIVRKEGWEIWALLGAFTSFALTLALIFYMRKWKTKIEELNGNDKGNN